VSDAFDRPGTGPEDALEKEVAALNSDPKRRKALVDGLAPLMRKAAKSSAPGKSKRSSATPSSASFGGTSLRESRVQDLMAQHPEATREEIVEMLDAFGG
jgi:hypothetical protein